MHRHLLLTSDNAVLNQLRIFYKKPKKMQAKKHTKRGHAVYQDTLGATWGETPHPAQSQAPRETCQEHDQGL